MPHALEVAPYTLGELSSVRARNSPAYRAPGMHTLLLAVSDCRTFPYGLQPG